MSVPVVIGNATLYLGDCMQVMGTLADESVGMAFTSPPYNLGEGMEDKGGLRVGHAGSKWGNTKLREGYGDEIVLIGKGAATVHCTPELVTTQLLESLERLRTDYVDIYLMHRDNPQVHFIQLIEHFNFAILHMYALQLRTGPIM